MKALSIQQPWAWAILEAGKRYENRIWCTNYRGPLLIHAGKSKSRLKTTSLPGQPAAKDLAFQAIVGIVNLVDCVPVAQVAGQPHAEGPWCWVLADPVKFAQPIPYRGQLNLFEVPIAVLLSQCAPEASHARPIPPHLDPEQARHT